MLKPRSKKLFKKNKKKEEQDGVADTDAGDYSVNLETVARNSLLS